MFESPEGKYATVVEEIRPDSPGEVRVAIRAGSEVFTAFTTDGEIIPRYSRVIIVEYLAPRSVFVAKA